MLHTECWKGAERMLKVLGGRWRTLEDAGECWEGGERMLRGC